MREEQNHFERSACLALFADAKALPSWMYSLRRQFCNGLSQNRCFRCHPAVSHTPPAKKVEKAGNKYQIKFNGN